MIRYIQFKSLLLLALISLAFNIDVHAVTVDIYVAMESGNNGEVLTPEIMEASTHGGIDSILGEPDWTLISGNCGRPDCPGCISNDMWVSTDNVRQLPGIVTVDGIDYTGSGTRTWKFSDLYKWNYVKIEYGSQREYTYKPWHARTTVACYYTPNPDQLYGYGCTFDNIILPVYNSYAVLQTIGETTIGSNPGMFIRAHGSKEDWDGTVSDTCITAEPGKTYWVNLHHDGPAGESKVAVYDPDNEYALVGNISISESIPWDGNGAQSRVWFGRADHHSDLDTFWDHETFSYFSHIMIDYTEGKFPLLPDIVQIKNLNDKKNTINPQIIIYPNPFRGNVIIHVRNISPAIIAGSRLKIFDLSGRLVDELKLQAGKFIWNNNSVSNGTYVMRLEGTRNYLSQRLLLIR